MKRLAKVCFCSIFYTTAVTGASLLKATSFPKTIADTSFTERTQNKAAGYEPYAGLSAYQIFELESAEDAAHRAIERELQLSGLPICDGCDENGNPPVGDGSTITPTTPDTTQPVATVPTPVLPVTPSQPTPSPVSGSGYCSRVHPALPRGQTVPFGLPVNTDDLSPGISSHSQSIANNTNRGMFCSPYGCGRGRPHEGVDIGCTADFYQMPIYATADGRVEKIVHAGKNQSAGNYIRINHGGGWITQYMHLDKILVTQGQQVSAGCMIGLMGHTGGNRDQRVRQMSRDLTHLHYEIIIYSGTASYVMSPNGKRIPIIRGDSKLGPCGNFKSKIYPNEIMVYE